MQLKVVSKFVCVFVTKKERTKKQKVYQTCYKVIMFSISLKGKRMF